jgi:hypothetical protein
MTATSGVLPAWPRRRHYAGFARGSAGGGATPIPIGSAHKRDLCLDLVVRSSALPGVRVRTDDDEGIATLLGASDATVLVRFTRTADLSVRLPAPVLEALRVQGWVASGTRTTALLHGPRTADERDVAWRVIALACASAVAAATETPLADTHPLGALVPPGPAAAMETPAPI